MQSLTSREDMREDNRSNKPMRLQRQGISKGDFQTGGWHKEGLTGRGKGKEHSTPRGRSLCMTGSLLGGHNLA